jgi:hypothetical protein
MLYTQLILDIHILDMAGDRTQNLSPVGVGALLCEEANKDRLVLPVKLRSWHV